MAYTLEEFETAISNAEASGDEAAATKLRAAAATAMQASAAATGTGAMATAMQGLSLGTADELAGLVGGPGAREAARAQVAGYRQQNPGLAVGLELAGALPTALGSGAGLARMAQLPGRMGRVGKALTTPAMLPQAALGGAEGAVAGAAQGTTGPERLKGGLVGGALGATTAGLATPVTGALTRRFAPGMEAEKLITGAMRQDLGGRTPTATDLAMMQARAGQQPQRTLAEVAGPTVEDLARTSAKVPTGGARQVAEAVLEPRRQRSTERLIESLRESTGSREDYWKNIRNLESQAKRDAKPLYEAARAAPFDPDDDLMELAARGVDTGEIKAGYEAARRQARLREGEKIQTWRELTGDDGMGLEDLNLETWDWIKRGLDARYKKVVRQDPAMAAAIWDYRQQVVRKLDEMVPEYRQARASYAGPMEQRDAQQAGRNVFKEDSEFTEEFISELSQGEKDAYITGAVQAIKDKLKSVPVEGGMPRFTQLAFDRLRNAFPSDEAADAFLASVLSERDMQRFRNMVLSGSPTAEIMASQEQAGRALGAAGGIGQVLGGQPVEGARTLAANLLPRRAATIPEHINNPLSRMLFSQGAAIPPVLQRLQAPPMVPRLLGPTTTLEAAMLANQAQRPRQQ